jgi:hypothetical protein
MNPRNSRFSIPTSAGLEVDLPRRSTGFELARESLSTVFEFPLTGFSVDGDAVVLSAACDGPLVANIASGNFRRGRNGIHC